MSWKYLAVLAMGMATPAAAEESYKLERLDEGPPPALAPAVRGTIEARGYRVVDPRGRPFVDVWLRKATPAPSKPSGPRGAVLYPVLAEGELLGAARFAAEGHDYRDQAIAPGSTPSATGSSRSTAITSA